jgi:hypothetical protein
MKQLGVTSAVQGGGKRRVGIAEGHESERQSMSPELKTRGRHNAYHENTLSRWLRWRNRPWHTHARQGAVLLPTAAGPRLCLPIAGYPLRLWMDLE